MNKIPGYLPLRVKLALWFAAVSMLGMGLTTYIYYQTIRTQMQRDIRERLHNTVAIAALQVDGAAHMRLTDPSQEGSPAYLRLKKTLQNIRDASSDIRFVYTMRQDERGRILFVVDAEESEADVSHLGDVYDDASPWLIKNFGSLQHAAVEDEMYTDKWGTWLTGYAPFYAPDGTRAGILGMDISVNAIVAREKQIRQQAIIFFLGSILPIVLLGWIFGTIMTGPLDKLSYGAKKLFSGDLDYRVDIRSRDELELLGQAFNSTAQRLGELVSELEQRVEERTQALSRRTAQLQAAAQVARRAAGIQDTAELLNDVVRLISNQFGFYHAGIFLLDEQGEYAVLQAASSDGGKRMLARGHRLQVGRQGIVGYAAAQKRARIALDVGTDAVYFNNPDLPDTRSEAALPLIARDRVIGLLDIQSDQPQAFSQDDIETFQTLADQIALAIENARVLNDMNMVVQQLEQSMNLRAQESWRRVIQAKDIIYRYTPLGVQPVKKSAAPPDENPKLNIPIKLHNQKIGEIRIQRKDHPTDWTSREKAMLAEIAAQIGLALENARLLEEAQLRAARERAIGEIANRIGAAHDVESILRITAQEIGKAISNSEVTVHLRGREESAKAGIASTGGRS